MGLDIKKYIASLDRPVKRAVEAVYVQIKADAKTEKADEIAAAKVEGEENTDEQIETLTEIFEEQAENLKMYQITFDGADASSAAAFSAIAPFPADVDPAVGDRIAFVTAKVKASGVNASIPALVAADSADGIVIGLLDDSGTVKVKFGRDTGEDYTANTYTAWVLPFVDLS